MPNNKNTKAYKLDKTKEKRSIHINDTTVAVINSLVPIQLNLVQTKHIKVFTDQYGSFLVY